MGATRAGAGRPWLACPLGCTPVGAIAHEVENVRVDLADESGEPSGTADRRPPDHPEPEMRRPRPSLACSDLGLSSSGRGDPIDIEAFGDLDHDLLESMAFQAAPGELARDRNETASPAGRADTRCVRVGSS